MTRQTFHQDDLLLALDVFSNMGDVASLTPSAALVHAALTARWPAPLPQPEVYVHAWTRARTALRREIPITALGLAERQLFEAMLSERLGEVTATEEAFVRRTFEEGGYVGLDDDDRLVRTLPGGGIEYLEDGTHGSPNAPVLTAAGERRVRDCLAGKCPLDYLDPGEVQRVAELGAKQVTEARAAREALPVHKGGFVGRDEQGRSVRTQPNGNVVPLYPIASNYDATNINVLRGLDPPRPRRDVTFLGNITPEAEQLLFELMRAQGDLWYIRGIHKDGNEAFLIFEGHYP